jgi:hypothetical protein
MIFTYLIVILLFMSTLTIIEPGSLETRIETARLEKFVLAPSARNVSSKS